MSLLIFAYRKLDINRRKSDLNYRLMELTRKLSDLQQYAANIGDGSVSMSDMMNTPSSMFGRQLMFMPARQMPLSQLFSHTLYTQTFSRKQNYQMIKHIRGFIHKPVISAVNSFYNCFKRFFSKFLRNPVKPVLEKTRRI